MPRSIDLIKTKEDADKMANEYIKIYNKKKVKLIPIKTKEDEIKLHE